MQKAEKLKYERSQNKFTPPEHLPNRLKVPENTILCISEHDMFNDSILEILEELKGARKRDWMNQHAYFCLPLVIGNQYGFIIKSYYDFSLYWDGSEYPDNLKVKLPNDYVDNGKQTIASHFGLGIATVQNRFSFRTSEGINLFVCNPPNYFIDGLQSLTAVVETDNLRRDFTFNLKVTRKNEWISITKGQPLAAVLPYPRHFIDKFKIALAHETIDPVILAEERRTVTYFAKERVEIDSQHAGRNGFRYMDGEDIYGISFKDHQKKLED